MGKGYHGGDLGGTGPSAQVNQVVKDEVAVSVARDAPLYISWKHPRVDCHNWSVKTAEEPPEFLRFAGSSSSK